MTMPADPLAQALRRAADVPMPGAREAAARVVTAAGRRGLVDLAYASVDSPVGKLLLVATRRGLVRVAFDLEPAEVVLADLAARVSPRIVELPARFDTLRAELDAYFSGQRRTFRTPVDWSLTTGFTHRVLRVTAGIPYGAVRTYAEVAGLAGSPRGARAAGNALHANPVPIVVPCHRVVRVGGVLGGYGGGPGRKELLLGLEGLTLGGVAPR